MPWDVLDSKDFGKSSNLIVRVSLVKNGDGNKLDIRNHYEKDGEWLPTKKGVSLKVIDSECSAKIVLLTALKIAGVSQKEIEDHFEYERVMNE